MVRKLTTWLLWLLIALLPVQGFAAAIALACAPVHAMQPASVSPMHEDGGTALHAGHHATSAMQDQADSPDAVSPGMRASDHHKHAACTHCAHCCMGAVALHAKTDWELPVAGMSVEIVAPALPVTGDMSTRLERPPDFSV